MEEPVGAGQKPTHTPPPVGADEEPLDLAVMRSLLALTGGAAQEFVECEIPPQEVQRWIRKADRRQLNGLFILALKRWHQLRRQEGEPTRKAGDSPATGSS